VTLLAIALLAALASFQIDSDGKPRETHSSSGRPT
jgi:hypothetical protein